MCAAEAVNASPLLAVEHGAETSVFTVPYTTWDGYGLTLGLGAAASLREVCRASRWLTEDRGRAVTGEPCCWHVATVLPRSPADLHTSRLGGWVVIICSKPIRLFVSVVMYEHKCSDLR
jgi:hypothetical protein